MYIIQALLGHASLDTVMIYAKLYPGQFIEEYRKSVRSPDNACYGEDGLKDPAAEEWLPSRRVATCATWARISAPCPLERALSEGVALPWLCACAAEDECGVDRSAPSTSASLVAAGGHSEPAGQITARETEIIRIRELCRERRN